MSNKIGSRYVEGLLVEVIDGRMFGIFTNEDYPIHRLYAKAESARHGFDLVIICQTETVEISDSGDDDGYIEADVYVLARMPFPYDVRLRKEVIRRVIENYKIP